MEIRPASISDVIIEVENLRGLPSTFVLPMAARGWGAIETEAKMALGMSPASVVQFAQPMPPMQKYPQHSSQLKED